MNSRRARILLCGAILLSSGTVAVPQSTSADATSAPDSDDVVTLSPFVVNADQDKGYAATDTLAGSRLKTALVDTAAAIDVMTAEFLSDLAVTNLEEAIEFSTNANNDLAVGDANENGQFSTGGESINIRGQKADRTRNYFIQFQAIDTYNIERLEENRGPNSILFGIGSAAGIINANTKRAILGHNALVIGGQVNSAGGTGRYTVDANGSSNNKRVALRLNAVTSQLDDPVGRHAGKKVNGATLAATVKLTDRISFHGEFERIKQDAAKISKQAGRDGVSLWAYNTADPRYVLNKVTGPTLPAGQTLATLGIATLGSADTVSYIDNSDSLRNFRLTHRTNGVDGDYGFIWEENHPELWDRSVTPGGTAQSVESDFKTYNLTLEGEITKSTFLELAYNHQDVVGNGMHVLNSTLRADPDATYADNVTPNPYAGQLYIENTWRKWTHVNDLDTIRATLSHEQDFGKWGNYRLALMYQHDDEDDGDSGRQDLVWVDADGVLLFNATQNNAANIVNVRHYIETEGNWDEYFVSPPDFTQGLPVVRGNGQTVNAYSTFLRRGTGTDFNNLTKSYLIGLQARYFKDHLVLGLGFRKDELRRRQFDSPLDHSGWTDALYDGKTKTVGAVYHINHMFRLMFNASDNFGLPSGSRKTYPDGLSSENVEGTGKDFGIGFRLFDDRLSGRVTYFETTGTNNYIAAFNVQGTNDELADLLLNAGAITPEQNAAILFAGGTGSVLDKQVEGYEFSMTFNVTRNWALEARYSYTDGFQTNSYPDQLAFIDGTLVNRDVPGLPAVFNGIPFYHLYDSVPISGQANYQTATTVGEYISLYEADLAYARSFDGVGLAKNRPHKASMVTRYSFSEGRLKGLVIGGGVKYQSAEELGIAVDENANPIGVRLGTSYTIVNMFAGYSFNNILGIKHLKVQLNVDNLFDKVGPLITGRGDDTGEIEKITYLQPRVWKLSATATF